jgi:hypothetical protein
VPELKGLGVRNDGSPRAERWLNLGRNIHIANGTAILLLLVVLFSAKKSLRHALFEEKVFYLMLFLNISQCLIESVVFVLDGKMIYGYRTLSMGLNTILFINNILFAFLWTVFVDYKLFTDLKRIKRIYPFVAIPAILIIIGCLINLATPVFFVVDKYNIYQRTVLFLVPYVVTYFYLAYGIVLSYSYRKKVNRYLFFPVILFMIPILIGSLLQFFYYGYSLVWLGVAVGLVSLFINVQNLEFEENRKFKCTVSVGVYSGQPDSDRNIQHFIDNADQALYRAKESGRNRVMSL